MRSVLTYLWTFENWNEARDDIEDHRRYFLAGLQKSHLLLIFSLKLEFKLTLNLKYSWFEFPTIWFFYHTRKMFRSYQVLVWTKLQSTMCRFCQTIFQLSAQYKYFVVLNCTIEGVTEPYLGFIKENWSLSATRSTTEGNWSLVIQSGVYWKYMHRPWWLFLQLPNKHCLPPRRPPLQP